MTDIEDQIMQGAYESITTTLDDLVIEGLKRKGYTFDNKRELISFIKENCTSKYFKPQNVTEYYVNDTPFLIYKNQDVEIKKDFTENKMTFSADLGHYQFI